MFQAFQTKVTNLEACEGARKVLVRHPLFEVDVNVHRRGLNVLLVYSTNGSIILFKT